MWRLIVLLVVSMAGFWFGMPTQKPISLANVDVEAEYPLTEHKSFVIVIYAHNQALWCKRTLRSVFEQDYPNYRIVMIDDVSIDGTEEVAKNYIMESHQDDKVLYIRNETYLGPVASLYRVIDHCLDREIIVPLEAKDWFTTPGVLNRLNAAYQNPDVWMATGWSIDYPTYRMREEGSVISYYAALFKEVRLHDLFSKGRFASHISAYLGPIKALAAGRLRTLQEPLGFRNLAPKFNNQKPIKPSLYDPLTSFPQSTQGGGRAEAVILAEGDPLQLYACLESIQRYVTGYEQLSVIGEAPKSIQDAFPAVQFCEHWTPGRADYVLLGRSHQIVKDFVDLGVCMEQVKKTGACGFFLQLGENLAGTHPPSHPLFSNTYVWELSMGEGPWAHPETQFALYPIATVQKVLAKEAKLCMPDQAIGLYFERSKSVNVEMDESIALFNRGLKIDLEPLHKVENGVLTIPSTALKATPR
ncbi:MAG: glycosyltransferase family 2 protein [Verrucomicrobia bacterium]|nr:glycosyltransferase family 2 protein [Verrucomicrobiota bacterium]MBU6445850.1 glycosyltransferase family 2 protein [Verrucomicrobiota bacterium]MDE3048245.1 glycosyltransferase family 2 protein [Verrucomicrobiota bacterium]